MSTLRGREHTGKLAKVLAAFVVVAVATVASCAKSSSSGSSGMAIAPSTASTAMANMSTTPPSPDPRIGLAPGTMKRWEKDTTKNVVDRPAAEASWNMRLISNSPPSDNFRGVTNSDLAFRGSYVYQGNYNGYQVWNISKPEKPVLTTAYFCPASQSDVSVHRNLLFVSSEAPSGRVDCTNEQMTANEANAHRMRGIRLFDGKDVKNPKYITNVQSCRGSHTHTVVDDPKDKDNIYIYISGTSQVRPEEELPGCLASPSDPNSALFRIEVIKIPVANPKDAKIASIARVFQDLPRAPGNSGRSAADSIDRANASAAAAASGRGAGGRGGRGGGGRGNAADTTAGRGGGGRAGRGGTAGAGGPNQCHDITVYPAIGRAGGACGGLGLLLDISDPANPKRLSYVADSNFAFWHSATFSNDGSKILFTDEWGGGGQPKCRSTDRYEWGGDALFTLQNDRMTFKSYFKMPAAQTAQENCVAHNGSLIPIPGRDVMIQGWYQGGLSVFDWTDISHPKEIAFFDRGPLTGERMVSGGSWSAYWYNGVIVSSEIARGLDIFELLPSGFISQNELDAAKTVILDQLNAQDQPKFVWPPSFALARAYADQLERSNGLTAARLASVRSELAAAEKLSGGNRKAALTTLATALHGEANASRDAAKAHMLAGAIGDLAK